MAVTGPPNAYILVPISVVIGAGEGLFLPGSYAIVPSLVPDAELEAGNAVTSGGTRLATLIGPGIGGAVVALAGVRSAFAGDAASFAISTMTLWSARSRAVAARQADAGPAAAQESDGAARCWPLMAVERCSAPSRPRRLAGLADQPLRPR